MKGHFDFLFSDMEEGRRYTQSIDHFDNVDYSLRSPAHRKSQLASRERERGDQDVLVPVREELMLLNCGVREDS